MTRYVKTLESIGIDPASASERLEAFAALFLRWNASINLSAARNLDDLDEHIVDSLHVIPRIGGLKVLDVGSGGGFPVVVTSICMPTVQFVGLEPVHKKHAFLRTVARELQLTNFVPLSERLESHPIFDYDLAMSRATFDLKDWIEQGLHHVRVGGHVIGFEGQTRDDLERIVRFPYEVAGKQRALVVATRQPP